MTRPPSLLALAALATILFAGCATGPSLHYRVNFAARDSSGVPVTLEIAGVPRDSLVLEGYLRVPLMTVRDVQVQDAGGRRLAATLTQRTLADAGGESDFPVVRLDGPLPSRLTLRYRAVLGTREGNEHTGFTGRCAGTAGEALAFAGGRSLFLVPSPVGKLRKIDVRFTLPPGWKAIVPWHGDGVWRTGVRGGAPVEDLLWSALGFGRFDERRIELQGTTFRFAFAAGVAPADRDSALRAYSAVARRITDAFGRGLGREFTVVVAPPRPDGDEIVHEGWATSMGGTLAPVTTARARALAESMIDAYLAQDPFRSTVREARERWIVDGVSRLLPWRALAAAGLAQRADFDRWIASDVAHELEDSDSSSIERDLETLAASEKDTRLAHEDLAPLAMLRLDDAVRASSGGRDSIDTVWRRVFEGSVARSLWASLPQPGNARWEALRARYVRGQGVLQDDSLFALSAPSEAPQPARGPVVRTLTLALTGNSYGYLENCGCKVNQAGGVTRRSTMLARLRRQGPTLALDAGNALMRPERFAPPDYLALEEEKVYLRSMATMGYPLAVVGPAELAYGLDRFRAAAAAAGFPFVIANARDSAGALAPAWRTVVAGGVRVGVIGLMEPGRGPWANDVLERHLGNSVRFEDPLAALQRTLPEARAQSDLVIAMGLLSPPTVRRLIAACPDLDVVVSTDEGAGARTTEDGSPVLASGDAGGFHGRTLVLYTTQSSYGLNGATLGLDASKRIASATEFASWLGDSVADDPQLRAQLTRFYEAVGRTQAAQASVPPLFPTDAARLNGDYVGAARCQPCHANEFAQWKESDHSSAYKTLLDVHRHYQPRCIVCHVVGYGTPKGFKMGSADTRLVGVQCELCHGPGAAHSASPRKDNVTRAVPAQVCLECHTPDHSDHFVYEEKLPRVVHQTLKELDANAAGGK